MSADPGLSHFTSMPMPAPSPRGTRDELPVYRQVPTSALTQPADVELSVSIELGRVRMRLADVLQMEGGCVIELDKSTAEPVDLVINDQILARGEVVVLGGKLAVRILEVTAAEPTNGSCR